MSKLITNSIRHTGASVDALTFDTNGNTLIADNEELQIGDSQDLTISHSSNLSTIKNTHASGLAVRSDVILLQNDAGDHDYLTTTNEEGVTLYHDNVNRLNTHADGIRIGHTGTFNNLKESNQGDSGHFISANGTIVHSAAGGTCMYVNRNDSNGTLIDFRRSGTQVGSVYVNGSNTTYNTSSDYRLKENEVAISDGIKRLKTLKPYRFNFKIDPDTTVDGFFAHEVTPAVPEAIVGEKDGAEMQGIDQSKLVPLLTAALQEAITKIETLETKVAALEAS